VLLSMTGFGEARVTEASATVIAEVRTVNSRFLKVTTRLTDGFASLEPNIEAMVRRQIRRATVQVNIRIELTRAAEDYRINVDVLRQYADQFRGEVGPILAGIDLPNGRVGLDSLLALPGVIDDSPVAAIDAQEYLPIVEETLAQALKNLGEMRNKEGAAMATDLADNCKALAAAVEKIEERAPLVVDGYRQRLMQRINKLLEEYEIRIEASDLIKEVGVYAERSDIAEETVRLRSHLEQFEVMLGEKESTGRKLEFLTQEMHREINTIGSKANDVEISKHVVEMKSVVERIREMIQNVE